LRAFWGVFAVVGGNGGASCFIGVPVDDGLNGAAEGGRGGGGAGLSTVADFGPSGMRAFCMSFIATSCPSLTVDLLGFEGPLSSIRVKGRDRSLEYVRMSISLPLSLGRVFVDTSSVGLTKAFKKRGAVVLGVGFEDLSVMKPSGDEISRRRRLTWRNGFGWSCIDREGMKSK